MEEESEVESSQSEVESEAAVDGPRTRERAGSHEPEQLAPHFLRALRGAREGGRREGRRMVDGDVAATEAGAPPPLRQPRGVPQAPATCVALEKAKKRRTLLGHQAMDKATRRQDREGALPPPLRRSRTPSTHGPAAPSRSRSTATTTTTRRRRRRRRRRCRRRSGRGRRRRRRLPGGGGGGGGARVVRALRIISTSSATSGRRCSRWRACATRPASPTSSSGSCSTAGRWRNGCWCGGQRAFDLISCAFTPLARTAHNAAAAMLDDAAQLVAALHALAHDPSQRDATLDLLHAFSTRRRCATSSPTLRCTRSSRRCTRRGRSATTVRSSACTRGWPACSSCPSSRAATPARRRRAVGDAELVDAVLARLARPAADAPAAEHARRPRPGGRLVGAGQRRRRRLGGAAIEPARAGALHWAYRELRR